MSEIRYLREKKPGVHYLNSFDQIFSSIFFWSGLFFGASDIVFNYSKYLYARNIYFFFIFSDRFKKDSYLIKFTRFCISIEGKTA